MYLPALQRRNCPRRVVPRNFQFCIVHLDVRRSSRNGLGALESILVYTRSTIAGMGEQADDEGVHRGSPGERVPERRDEGRPQLASLSLGLAPMHAINSPACEAGAAEQTWGRKGAPRSIPQSSRGRRRSSRWLVRDWTTCSWLVWPFSQCSQRIRCLSHGPGVTSPIRAANFLRRGWGQRNLPTSAVPASASVLHPTHIVRPRELGVACSFNVG